MSPLVTVVHRRREFVFVYCHIRPRSSLLLKSSWDVAVQCIWGVAHLIVILSIFESKFLRVLLLEPETDWFSISRINRGFESHIYSEIGF